MISWLFSGCLWRSDVDSRLAASNLPEVPHAAYRALWCYPIDVRMVA